MNIDEQCGNAEPYDMRGKNEGAYRGGEGTTPVTTAFAQKKIAERKTPYELSWKSERDD